MRPRHYAGESGSLGAGLQASRRCFNEAPALRRGKYAGADRWTPAHKLASMRPRHYAGESGGARDMLGAEGDRFNEAPALRRGKFVGEQLPGVEQPAASMRPRHYAGESQEVLITQPLVESLLQ